MRGLVRGSGVVSLLALLACGGKAPPTADDPTPAPPDLAGAVVMLLPAQTGGRLAGLDAELGFWLEEALPRTRWVRRPAMERAVARSPEWSVDLDALPVGAFMRAEMETIGASLYSDLRRLGAMLDARIALVPVAAAFVRKGPEGEEPAPDADGRVEIAAAVIDTIGGRVLWYGIVAGEMGPAPDAPRVASAARALARALSP